MNTEQNDFSGRTPSGTIRSLFFWVFGWDVSQPFGWKSLPCRRAAFNLCSPETAHMRSTDPRFFFLLCRTPISCPQTASHIYLMAFPVFPQLQDRTPNTSPFSKVGKRREREGEKRDISELLYHHTTPPTSPGH